MDLLATDPGSGHSRLLATDVMVLAGPLDVPEGPAGGSLVVLGVPDGTTLEVTAAGLAEFVTIGLGG